MHRRRFIRTQPVCNQSSWSSRCLKFFLCCRDCNQIKFACIVAEEGNSWDLVSENDLWEDVDTSDEEDYVLVRQDDIVDGIACFMAAYLLSLKKTKVCIVVICIFFCYNAQGSAMPEYMVDLWCCMNDYCID